MRKFGILGSALFLLCLLTAEVRPKPTKKIKDSDVEQIVEDLTKLVEELKVEHCEGDSGESRFSSLLSTFDPLDLHI